LNENCAKERGAYFIEFSPHVVPADSLSASDFDVEDSSVGWRNLVESEEPGGLSTRFAGPCNVRCPTLVWGPEGSGWSSECGEAGQGSITAGMDAQFVPSQRRNCLAFSSDGGFLLEARAETPNEGADSSAAGETPDGVHACSDLTPESGAESKTSCEAVVCPGGVACYTRVSGRDGCVVAVSKLIRPKPPRAFFFFEGIN